MRVALRETLGGALTEEQLTQAAKVATAATMTWLIEATKDGKTGGTVEVNADDALRDH